MRGLVRLFSEQSWARWASLTIIGLVVGVVGFAATGASNEVARVSVGEGVIIDHCLRSKFTQRVEIEYEFFEGRGGGTLQSPAHPFGDQGIPFSGELRLVGSSALVRPDPHGGNDVVYSLRRLSDGTFVIDRVSYCTNLDAEGRLILRPEFEDPGVVTDEMQNDGAYLDDEGVLTDG